MNAPLQHIETQDRRKFIGGSDAAAILGVSPWTTPLQLYIEKTKPDDAIDHEEDAKKALFFKRRKRQEPVIAEILRDEYGVEITRLSTDENPNRYMDSEYGFMASEIDFEFRMTPEVRERFPEAFADIPDGEICNGEIKTVHPFKAYEWGEEGSEEVPIYYAAQVMQGMGVTGRRACLVAALFGVDILLCFPILRDDETIEAMRQKVVAFWYEHIEAGIPPEPSNMDDIKYLFAKTRGKPVEVSLEIAQAMTNLKNLRADMKLMELQKEELEFKIGFHICQQWGFKDPEETKDNAILTYMDNEIGSWKSQKGSHLDQKRLKEEKPEITSEYTVPHYFRMIRFKK